MDGVRIHTGPAAQPSPTFQEEVITVRRIVLKKRELVLLRAARDA